MALLLRPQSHDSRIPMLRAEIPITVYGFLPEEVKMNAIINLFYLRTRVQHLINLC
jgi:hypothetical protein